MGATCLDVCKRVSWRRVLAVASALLLATVFAAAALHKAAEPHDAIVVLRWLGVPKAEHVVLGVTIFEIALAASFIAGLRPRLVFAAGAVFLFGATMVLFLARRSGYIGACGCLPAGMHIDEFMRNGLLLVVCGIGTWVSGSYQSMEV